MNEYPKHPTYRNWIWYSLVLGSIIFCPGRTKALTINEVAYDVKGADTGREWIEIYNETSKPVDLTGAKLQANHRLVNDPPPSPTTGGSLVQSPPDGGGLGSLVVPPGGYLLLAQKPDLLRVDYPSLALPMAKVSFTALPNYQGDETKESTLKVINSEGHVIAETNYMPGGRGSYSEGVTAEYQGERGWQPSKEIGGTPGKANSQWSEPAIPSPMNYVRGVRFSEIYPNPAGDDTGKEWVEFVNTGDQPVDLTGWYLTDATGKKEVLTSDNSLEPGAYLQIMISTLSINNDSTKTIEILQLFWPNDETVDTLTLSDRAKEDYSFSRFGEEWQWTDKSTPGATNQRLSSSSDAPTMTSVPTGSPQLVVSESIAQPTSLPTTITAKTSTKEPTINKITPAPKKSAEKLTPAKRSVPSPQTVSASPTRKPVAIERVAGVSIEKQGTSHRPLLISCLSIIVLLAFGLTFFYRLKLLTFIPKLRALWPPEVLK